MEINVIIIKILSIPSKNIVQSNFMRFQDFVFFVPWKECHAPLENLIKWNGTSNQPST